MTLGRRSPQPDRRQGRDNQQAAKQNKLKELKEILTSAAKEGKGFATVVEEKLGKEAAYSPDPKEGWAYQVATGSNMRTTQLRKVFSEVTSLERLARRSGGEARKWVDQLPMLKVSVAYATARGLMNKDAYECFKALFTRELLRDVRDVEEMADFFRAVVAYRKLEETQKQGGEE